MPPTTPLRAALGIFALASPSAHAATPSRITVHADDVRQADAVAFLDHATTARLEPLWRDRTRDGLDPDALVSLHLENATLTDALDRLLEQTATTPFVEDAPTWQRTPAGAVQLGPRSRLNDHKRVVVDDLRDLTHIVPDFDAVPVLDLQSVLQQGSGSGSIFRDPSNAGEWTGEREPAAEEIRDLVLAMVEPVQWRTNGGDGADLRLLGDVLVVNAPGYVHRRLGR